MEQRVRWALFIDGENLVARAHEIAKRRQIAFSDGAYCGDRAFIWYPGQGAKEVALAPLNKPRLHAAPDHAYYYASVVGNEPRIQQVRLALQQLGFDPHVFKKAQGTSKAKQVDVAMAIRMVAGACDDEYDVAVVVSGDEDFVPAVEEVRRRGKKVYGWFFKAELEGGLSPRLRAAIEVLFPLENQFWQRWEAHLHGQPLPTLQPSSSSVLSS